MSGNTNTASNRGRCVSRDVCFAPFRDRLHERAGVDVHFHLDIDRHVEREVDVRIVLRYERGRLGRQGAPVRDFDGDRTFGVARRDARRRHRLGLIGRLARQVQLDEQHIFVLVEPGGAHAGKHAQLELEIVEDAVVLVRRHERSFAS